MQGERQKPKRNINLKSAVCWGLSETFLQGGSHAWTKETRTRRIYLWFLHQNCVACFHKKTSHKLSKRMSMPYLEDTKCSQCRQGKGNSRNVSDMFMLMRFPKSRWSALFRCTYLSATVGEKRLKQGYHVRGRRVVDVDGGKYLEMDFIEKKGSFGFKNDTIEVGEWAGMHYTLPTKKKPKKNIYGIRCRGK